MKVLIDARRDPEDVLIAKARRVWAEGSAARTSPQKRRADFGKKRASRGAAESETTFMKKRRLPIPTSGGARLASIDSTYQGIDDLPQPDMWGPAHAKELGFQQARFAQRKVQAARESQLLDHEMSDALKSAAVLESKRIVVDHEKRVEKRSRDEMRATGCAEPAKSTFHALRLALL